MYGKNAVAPSVETKFLFRTEELGAAMEALQASSLLVIAGPAGVGKTRFALECADRFVGNHPAVTFYSIYNRGLTLYSDLHTYFDEKGDYLILVDDANRLAGLVQVLDLLRSSVIDRNFKIIMTVRDYALSKVNGIVHPFGTPKVIALAPLDDQQIRDIAKQGYGVEHHLFLDRIATIAKGNPRLAVMAAIAAKSTGSFESVRDASSLYDSYFESIRNDLEIIQNQTVLAVAGVVSLFRVVDRTNAEMMNIIQTQFDLPPVPFWSAVNQLHDLELVDVYDGEVVRLIDQVLSTYLFYLAFFKKRLLSFSPLLEALFPRFRHRIIDALKPVAETFPSDKLQDEVRVSVVHAWKAFEERRDDSALLQLIDTFGTVRPSETLLFVRDQIAQMPCEPDTGDELPSYANCDSTIQSPSILSILQSFHFMDEANVKIATQLICDYANKRPSDIRRVVHLLQDIFGIDTYSYIHKFKRERAVIDILTGHAQGGQNQVMTEILMSVAETYLQTDFHKTSAIDTRAFRFLTFAVPQTPELEALRHSIWTSLFGIMSLQKSRTKVFDILVNQERRGILGGNSEIIASDAPLLLELIPTRLDPTKYEDCAAAQSYLDFLDRHNVEYETTLREYFRNPLLALAEVLTGSKIDQTESDWRKEAALWLTGVREYVVGYDAERYHLFFEQCLGIWDSIRSRPVGYSPEVAVAEALAATSTSSIFVEVMRDYLRKGNRLQLSPANYVEKLIEALGSDATFELLLAFDYLGKPTWLFKFFQLVPGPEVRSVHVEAICDLYDKAGKAELPSNFEYLETYMAAERLVVCRVVSVVIQRATKDPTISSVLASLFKHYAGPALGHAFRALCSNDPSLLRRAYLVLVTNSTDADRDGQGFEALLDIDPEFLDVYVDALLECSEDWRTHRSHDYSFLWNRTDYSIVAERMVERMYDWRIERGKHWSVYPGRLFDSGLWRDRTDAYVSARQDDVVGNLMRKRRTDGYFIRCMFSIIADFSANRRLRHVETLFEINRDFALFRELDLESSHMSWSGSKIPLLEKRASFWRSAGALCSEIDLLDHRQFIDEHLEHAQNEIEMERRKEFMED